MPLPRFRSLLVFPLLFAGLGCAEGGSDANPPSEVQIAASHYVWVMSSLQQLTFPVQAMEVVPDFGSFVLSQNSTYQVTLPGVNAQDNYTLSNAGVLGILLDQGPTSASIRYSGAYGLEGDTGHFFFTDRFTTSSSPGLGLFWGTRIEMTTPDVEGDWHLFSQHVMFSSSMVQTPNNIGRSVAGSVTIDSAGAVTGQGLESTLATIQFTGMATSFPDSRVDFTLDYQDPQATDTRSFVCSLGGNTILGLNPNDSQGETGLIALVKKRTGTADPTLLEGDYHIGMHTIFVDPSQPGMDVAIGTLTFNATGGFTLQASGAPLPSQQPFTFTYTGSYVLSDDGQLILTLPTTNQTWPAAVDQDYKTIVIADNFVEQITGAKPPELNLCLALREQPPATTP